MTNICRDFNGSLTKPPWKLGHGTPHSFMWIQLHIHARIPMLVEKIFIDKRGPRDPLFWYGLTLIPVWTSNYIHYKKWDDITYPFPIVNGCTVEAWGCISNFIPHFIMYVITYPCRDLSQVTLVKGTPGVQAMGIRPCALNTDDIHLITNVLKF